MTRVAYTLTAALCCLSFMLSAQTTWTGATDNDWYTASNWSNNLPSSGNNATIPAAGTPFLTLSSNYVFDFDILNEGSITIDLAGFNLNNNGIFTNNENVSTSGNGTFSNLSSISNGGAFTSSSVFTNSFTGNVDNTGTIILDGSTINFSTIENTAGSLTINGDFDNGGTINNSVGAAIFVFGNFENLAGYVVNNQGNLELNGSGIWSNFGMFDNAGSFTNSSQFINYSGAVLSNNVGGTVSNQRTFINQGAIQNAAVFENTSCNTFQADDASSSMNIGAGTFSNNGIVRQFLSGAINITDGTGVVFTDSNELASPTMSCFVAITLNLDATGNSTLTIDEVDNGSTADYCFIASRSISKTDFSCSDIGTELVILTVTDGNGGSNVCQTSVTIEDNEAPILVSCPTDIIATLEPGDCNQSISYAVTATDNCSMTTNQIDASGYTSGDIFPEGTTLQEYEITDGTSTVTCSFNVTLSGAELENDGLICNNQLNVSLNENCEYTFSPNLMLAGSDVCEDLFHILINDVTMTTLDESWIGQNVMVSVVNNETGNSCWGNALIEDKLPPTVENCEAVTINCLQNPLPTSAGGDIPVPTFTDCSDFFSSYSDEMISGECVDSYSIIINRTWTATDAYGRSNTCLQVIVVERISFADVTPSCPANYLSECIIGETSSTSPEVTGYPTVTISGQTYTLEGAAANACLGVNYTDLELLACSGMTKIVRTWSIVEWCEELGTPTNPFTCTQMIEIADDTAPVISVPDDLTITVGDNCVALPTLPSATVTDCSSEITWNTLYPLGQTNDNGGLVTGAGLNIGEHIITYTATDDCGNTGIATMTVTVIDDEIPVAVCDGGTVVSLTNDGFGEVFATTFDDGSSDNCCLESVRIARMEDNCGNPDDLEFGIQVELCCADVGNETMVILQVTDCYGNQNTCMAPVTVEFEDVPVIVCPPDKTIECTDDITNTSTTGEAFGSSNCGDADVTYTDSGNMACNGGLITRTWTVTSANGNTTTCDQMIMVINSDPFQESDIVCPANYEATGCTPDTSPAVTGEPIIDLPSCSTISVTYDDVLFNNALGYCMKIVRTWTIIDDCVYDGSTNSGGIYQCIQSILISNSEAPTLDCNDYQTFCNMNENCGSATLDLSISNISDDCTPHEDLQIVWVVDINNDGQIDTGSSASGTGQNIGNSYPVGTHQITYTVKDDCGNATICTFSFTVQDCTEPVAICPNNIVIEMAAVGDTPLNASQINVPNSTDNCTATEDLLVSFSSNINDVERIYNCDHIGIQDLNIYVTDEDGNQDVCTITVTVQDNMNVCPEGLMIAGALQTEIGNTVEEVMVSIEGNEMNETMTDEAGHYEYPNANLGQNYTLTPHSNQDWLNGVSTYDIVLIRRHVLSTEILTSPYQILAADVNNSGSVTTADALVLRSLILQMITELPNNNAWRFVDSNYTFPEPTNPWAEDFPETVSLENVTESTMQNNFIAVKVGDLNSTAITNGLANESEERTNDIFNLNIINQKLNANQEVIVDISANELTDISAYQMTFNFDMDALEFISINPGELHQKANFGLRLLEHGAITCSWDNSMTTATNIKSSLFSVTLRAKKATDLSESLNINSRFTQAVAYRNNGESQDIQLTFSDESGNMAASDNFTLYQNKPNPFREETAIGFDMPSAGKIVLKIYDISGKVLLTTQRNAEIGYNEITLTAQDISAKGVFYYELSNDAGFTATKKMILTR